MVRYFFDVPVYRLRADRYYREMEDFIEKTMFPGPPEYNARMKAFYSREPKRESSLREYLREQFGGAWN